MKTLNKLLLFFTLLISVNLSSQTLVAGDIAFIGFNTDASEGFSFITLTDIPSNEEIYFTERGVIDSAAWSAAAEELWRFKAPSGGIACGTVISIIENTFGSNVYSISGVTGATMTWISGANPTPGINLGPGDQMLAFQSTTSAPPSPGDVTFIAGIHTEFSFIAGEVDPTTLWTKSSQVTSTSQSALPPGLTNGVNCLSFDTGSSRSAEFDNFKYTGTLTGTSAVLRAEINDETNWSVSNSPTFNITPGEYSPSVTCTAPNNAPVIGGVSAGQTVNDTATISLFSTITITDAEGDNLSATITLDDNGKGVLSGTGLTGTGPYTIASTTPADLQAKLRALSFNPTDNRTATSETTTFTVAVNDGTNTTNNTTTTVIASAVAPLVSSVSVPVNATYTLGQNLDFTVNFNEAVTVTGFPQVALVIGGGIKQAVYQSGSGSSSIIFRYVVQNGDVDLDGISVNTSISPNGGTLKDTGGKDANLGLNSVGTTTGVLVDTVAPTFENSTPSVNTITQTGFTIATDINEAGHIYYVVVADGATAPTPTEVKAGTGSGGSGEITAGNQIVNSGAFTYNFNITGLVAGTAYDVYVVAQDEVANLQAAVSKVELTTTGVRWTGATDDDWNKTTNWSTGTIPIATDNVVISNVINLPVITSSGEVNNLVVENNAAIFIDNNSSLIINGDLELKTNAGLEVTSTVPAAGVINSGSVILKGSYTEVTANSFKYFTETYHNNDSGWTLVSSPTVGEKIDGGATGFATFNQLQTSGANYGIAPYDNSVATNRWDYYTTAEIAATNNVIMERGKGYSILPNSTASANQNKGNIGFKGTIPVTDVTIAVTNNNGTGGNAFNLLGNPYPTYIPANTNADATNNILTINTGVLEEETLWFWDKQTSAYLTVNQATLSRFVSPTQGFFVKSNLSGGTFSFTKVMQSAQTSGVYHKNSAIRPEIEVVVKQGEILKNTNIFYINGTTTGFDNGYDSSIFGDNDSNFTLFTGLVDNSENKQLAIQSLPDSNYNDMIIPLGVKVMANKELNFSITAKNLPTDINVYLEDRKLGVFINLSENDYKKTFNEDINGIGRFYIHTSSKALSVENIGDLTSVGIFKNNNKLLVHGLQTKARLQILNVLGKQVLSSVLEEKITNTVILPTLTKGMYIVQIVSKKGKLNKKIIID